MSFLLVLGVLFTAQGVRASAVENDREIRWFGMALIGAGSAMLAIFAGAVR